jgi:hypothetical protein
MTSIRPLEHGCSQRGHSLNECTDSFGSGFAMTSQDALLLTSTPAMAEDEIEVTGTAGNVSFDTTAGTW